MRLSAIGAADTGFSNCNSLIISFSFATHSNQRMYTTRVSAFSFYLKKKTPAKEKQTQGCAPRPRERHAAALSLRLSVSCSAHSPVNSLRSNSTGNVAEAPPVADEARRCWRKTRSIAPAPRAIGDYVLRGLDGLLCKPHEPALVQAPARLRANVPSCLLSSTSYVLRRGVRGVSGRSPEFAFHL